MARWDHKTCAGHFRHAAFAKRLCVVEAGDEADARAFADELAAVIAAPDGRRPTLPTPFAERETWANRPYKAPAAVAA